MADEVQVRFTSDISDIKRQLAELDGKMAGVGSTAAKTGSAISSNLNKAGEDIKSGFGNAIAGLASGFSALFAVNQLKAYASESIKAFAEAEAQTNALRFAVEKVGKLGGAAFKDLVRQSKELAKVSFFDDEDIQSAQKLFVQIGLNSDEVKKLTPLVLDLAAAQGTSLNEAAQKAVGAVNGVTRGLKDVGANFENTKTAVGNLNELMGSNGLLKIQGAAADALNTTAGAMRKQDVAAEDLMETLGGKLAPAYNKVRAAVLGFGVDLAGFFFPDPAKEGYLKKLDDAKAILVKKFANVGTDVIKQEVKNIQQQIEETKKKIIAIQAGPSERKSEEIQVQRTKSVSLKTDEFALRSIVLDRISNERNAIENANSLKKEDQRKADALAKEAEEKKLADLLANSKKEADARKAAQKDEIAAAANKLEKDNEAAAKHRVEVIKGNDALKDENLKFQKSLTEQEKKAEDDRLKQEKKAEDDRLKIEQEASRKRVELINAYAQVAQEVLTLVTTLTTSGITQQLDALNEAHDNRVTQLDDEAAALEKKNERGTISDRAYAKQKAALDLKKKRADEEYQKQQKKFQHDQAVAEKQSAIFSIIIKTAQAIMSALAVANPGLAAFAAIIGALELATVIAQPIPKFKSGTKFVDQAGAPEGRDTILSWLDRGERVVTRDNNKKHWDVYNSLETGNFDKYVQRHYITPQLIAAKKKKDLGFADQIANSMLLNFSHGDTDSLKIMMRKGVKIQNADEVGIAAGKYIADNLNTNTSRRKI